MGRTMKSYLLGLIMSIQFFTSIPIRKEVPMTPRNIERAIQTFPMLGWLQGCFYGSLLYSLIHWTDLTDLAVAFALWLSIIVLTGGIHLDGWIDCSDAFFSYRDKNKRLEIMKDPRTGAFGVISVIVLLGARFLFIYEVILKIEVLSYILIIFVPLLSKILMGTMLVRVPLAKKEGLAHLFQQSCHQSTLWIYPLYIVAALMGFWIWQKESIILLLCMLMATIFLFLFLRKKVIDWFGGITGDVVGATTEGVECCLWMIVWFFHYYGMGGQ